MLRVLIVSVALGTASVGTATAQQPAAPPASPSCSYVECGLGIAPSLISLDVVQGSRSRPDAS
jgi:hypothetical protein